MIKPINGHLLIQPLEHKTFLQGDKSTFEEIGIVLAVSKGCLRVRVGYKVFFDSWLAAKFPKGDDDFYWLVKYDDVRAIEKDENTIPE